MSVLHLTQISRKIRELFEAHIPKGDLSAADPDVDAKVLTRCLTAYAIYNASGCTALEAGQAVVDGSGDNGLDGLFVSPANKRVYVVQSKWIKSGSGEPSLGDVLKFREGIHDLLDLDFTKFNKQIGSLQGEIERALEDFDTRYELILIYTGTQKLSEPATSAMAGLVSELNDTAELVEFSPMNQSAVYASIPLNSGHPEITLEIGLSQWGKIDDPYTAYFGIVQGEEIGKWWVANGDKLLDKNLRYSLGRTDVNEEVRATLHSNPEHFWYFNNGITLIAKKVTKSMAGGSSRDFGTFKAEDVFVVNGAQTVSTIGRVAKAGKSSLAEVRVPIRVISLDKALDAFGASVTRTNNRQNRIEPRDFVSQDPEQARLKSEMAHELVEYSLVRAESFAPSDTAFDATEAASALACSSDDPALAVQLKREIGKFWEDLTKSPYKALFNPSISGVQVIRCVRMHRVIESSIKKLIDKHGKKSGRYYGTLVHGNRMIALLVMHWIDRRLIDDPATTFNIGLLIPKLEQATEEAANRLHSAVNKSYSTNFLATLFKNASNCKVLFDTCKAPAPK